VLFSGGVDSTFLAYMLHRVLPPSEPIDLINIAFQRDPSLSTPLASRGSSSSSTPLLSTPASSLMPSSSATPKPGEDSEIEAEAEGETRPPNGLSAADHARLEKENGEYAVPDRIGGREALEELKRTCEREWRFVEVDVPFDVSEPDNHLERPSVRAWARSNV
jgi:asparagine synthetase B (glutamine-hydrolysing)